MLQWLPELTEMLKTRRLPKNQAAHLFGLSRSGFDLQFAAVKKGPGAKAEYYAEKRRLYPQPKRRRTRTTAQDRAVLQELRSIAWPAGAAERGALPAIVIERHFSKVSRMIDEKKITCKEAAPLFSMSESRLYQLRAVCRREATVASGKIVMAEPVTSRVVV
jgi:hypothetical protein